LGIFSHFRELPKNHHFFTKFSLFYPSPEIFLSFFCTSPFS
jgi:hypothetical protein